VEDKGVARGVVRSATSYKARIQSNLKETEVSMKTITLVGILSILFLSGITVAQQSGEPEKSSSMQGMMQDRMKGEKTGEGGMQGMMQMMRMMNQCAAMMEECCSSTDTGKAKEAPKQ